MGLSRLTLTSRASLYYNQRAANRPLKIRRFLSLEQLAGTSSIHFDTVKKIAPHKLSVWNQPQTRLFALRSPGKHQVDKPRMHSAPFKKLRNGENN